MREGQRAERPRRATIVPLVLVAVGLTLLVGCFAIPATRQFQTNGKPRPETLVGADPHRAIVYGQTLVETALLALEKQTAGDNYMPGTLGPPETVPGVGEWEWRFSPDGRRVGVEYQLRTATEVWILRSSAGPKFARRQLVLDVDPNGIVIGSSTVAVDEHPLDPRLVHCVAERLPEVYHDAFSGPVRARLEAAGLGPRESKKSASERY